MRMLIAVLALLVFAPAAQAARLQAIATEREVPATCGEGGCQSDFTFLAAYAGEPGEANRVTFARDGALLRVREEGASLTVTGPQCRVTDRGSAECDVPAGTVESRVQATLGDGDDTASFAGIASVVQGGTGNDTLRGGELTDQLEGGEGDDTLAGGASADALDGGTGADAIDGGDGADLVFYARPTGVAVDLADPAPDGAPGEGDRITGVENVQGGSGDDALAGDEGDNLLFGGSGRDRLTGRGGRDRLDGGTGVDTYDAGPGDDELMPHDGAGDPSDVLGCGGGDDTVFEPDVVDVLEGDCEQVAPENLDAERAQPVAVRGGAILLALAQREGLGNKRATVTVRAPGRRTVLARAAFRTRPGAAPTRVRALL